MTGGLSVHLCGFQGAAARSTQSTTTSANHPIRQSSISEPLQPPSPFPPEKLSVQREAEPLTGGGAHESPMTPDSRGPSSDCPLDMPAVAVQAAGVHMHRWLPQPRCAMLQMACFSPGSEIRFSVFRAWYTRLSLRVADPYT
jgi:hypothetical protein